MSTDVPTPQTAGPEHAESPGGDAGAVGRFERIDRVIYAAEQALVVGALLIMTLTYVLTVLWSNMTQRYNTIDRMFVKWMGYKDLEGAPQDVLDQVSGLITPLSFGAVVFGLAMAAVLTRERTSLAEGASLPAGLWPRRLLTSLVLTVGTFGFLKLIEVVPSRFTCLIALAALMAVAWQRSRHFKDIAVSMGAAVVGGVIIAIYFITKAGDTYAWNEGLAAVLLMYIGFMGASMATRDGMHLRVDAIRKSMKGKGYHLYNFISDVVTILFTTFLFVMAFLYLLNFLDRADLSHTASDLPQYVVVFPIAFAFMMMMVRFSANASRSLKAWRRGDLAPAPEVELH